MRKATVWVILGMSMFLMTVSSNSAWASSNIMGKVADPISGQSLVGVTVVAKTNTDILEEKRQARIETKTNSKGEFKISGVLPNKQYVISVVAKTGFVGGQQYVETPGNNKTKIMNETLYLTKDPSSPGLFIVDYYSKLKQVMRLPKKHDSYLDFMVNEVPVWRVLDPNLTFVFCAGDNYWPQEIGGIRAMQLKENPDDSISLTLTDQKVHFTSHKVGKGTAGEVTVIKAQVPKSNDKVYYGTCCDSMWSRQVFVFAVSPKSAEVENAEVEQKNAEFKKNTDNADKILLGAWKDENSQSTFYADGTCHTVWDRGYEEIRQWRVENGYIYTTAQKFKKSNENWQPVNAKQENKTKILRIDNDQYIIADNESKFWHSKRTATSTAVEELKKNISNASKLFAEMRISLPGRWKTEEGVVYVYEKDGRYSATNTQGQKRQGNWAISDEGEFTLTFLPNGIWKANIISYTQNSYTLQDNKKKYKYTSNRIE